LAPGQVKKYRLSFGVKYLIANTEQVKSSGGSVVASTKINKNDYSSLDNTLVNSIDVSSLGLWATVRHLSR